MLSVELPLLIISMTKERMETASQPRMAFVLPNLSQVVPTIGLRNRSKSDAADTMKPPTMGLKPTSEAYVGKSWFMQQVS